MNSTRDYYNHLRNYSHRAVDLSQVRENVDSIRERTTGIKIVTKARWLAHLGIESRLETVIVALRKLRFVYINVFVEYCEGVRRIMGVKEWGDKNLAILSLCLKKYSDERVSYLSTSFGKWSSGAIRHLSSATATEVQSARIKAWLYNDRSHTWGSEGKDGFREMFKNAASKVLRHNISPASWKYSEVQLETFYADWMTWATSGASDSRVARKYGLENTKLFTKMVDRDYGSQVLEISAKDYKPVSSAMPKHEGDAERLIVLADTVGYIAMSYLSYITEYRLRGNDYLFNYYGRKSDFWASRMEASERGRWILDLDYSGWDEGVTHEMIETCCDAITELAVESGGDGDTTRRLGDLAKKSMTDYRLSGWKGKPSSGLISGSRWTTLINSICNAAITLMARDLADESTNEHDFAVLGDDSDQLVMNERKGRLIMERLSGMGFTINKDKSKLQRSKGEFLKQSYNGRHVTGDPRRLVRALLWSRDEERREEGVEARVSIWAQMISRNLNVDVFGLDESEWKEIVADDMYRGMRRQTKKEDVLKWLESPTTSGGAGLFPSVDYTFIKKAQMGNLKPSKEVVRRIAKEWGGWFSDMTLTTMADLTVRNVRRVTLEVVDKPKGSMVTLDRYVELHTQRSNHREIMYLTPRPTRQLLYTRYALREKIGMKEWREYYGLKSFRRIAGVNWVDDGTGELYDSVFLIQKRIVDFVSANRHRYSMRVLDSIWSGDNLVPFPPIATIIFGETLAADLWGAVSHYRMVSLRSKEGYKRTMDSIARMQFKLTSLYSKKFNVLGLMR